MNQLLEKCYPVICPNNAFADQKVKDAIVEIILDIFSAADSAGSHRHLSGLKQSGQVHRRPDIGVKGGQIAIVDPDQLGTGLMSGIVIPLVVNLHLSCPVWLSSAWREKPAPT